MKSHANCWRNGGCSLSVRIAETAQARRWCRAGAQGASPGQHNSVAARDPSENTQTAGLHPDVTMRITDSQPHSAILRRFGCTKLGLHVPGCLASPFPACRAPAHCVGWRGAIRILPRRGWSWRAIPRDSRLKQSSTAMTRAWALETTLLLNANPQSALDNP